MPELTSHQVRFAVGVAAEGPGDLVADRWDPPGPAHGVVLLLHGGGQARGSWYRSAASLAGRGWTVYALDLRGHGDSAWAADGDYALDSFVADVAQVAGELTRRHGSAPVLVGASLGGWISLVLEGENPGRARGLVLVDIVHRFEVAGVERIKAFMLAHRDGFASLDEVAGALHAYRPDRPRESDPARLSRNVRLRADGRWYWHWDPAFMGPPAGVGPDVTPERLAAAARGVTVPTLLVRGDRSDVVSRESVREMLALIPGSRWVDVAEAGHMVVGDDNDVFTAALAGLLDEIAGGAGSPGAGPAAGRAGDAAR